MTEPTNLTPEQELLNKAYTVICGLYNVIYQENNLGEVQGKLHELGYTLENNRHNYLSYLFENLPSTTRYNMKRADELLTEILAYKKESNQ